MLFSKSEAKIFIFKFVCSFIQWALSTKCSVDKGTWNSLSQYLGLEMHVLAHQQACQTHTFRSQPDPTLPSQPCSSFCFPYLRKWQCHISTCSSPKPWKQSWLLSLSHTKHLSQEQISSGLLLKYIPKMIISHLLHFYLLELRTSDPTWIIKIGSTCSSSCCPCPPHFSLTRAQNDVLLKSQCYILLGLPYNIICVA